MSDLIAVLTWWVLAQIFGLVGLPAAFRLFHRLPDRGYGISKALGLLLSSYLFWLLGMLGLLRNDSGDMLFSIAVAAAISLIIYSRRPTNPDSHTQSQPAPTNGQTTTLRSWLSQNWKLVLIIEIVFLLSFAAWALYRAYVPRIMMAGGEKFMELAFLNGFQRSETLPPLDPWLSGYAISYYYFGYLMMSIFIRLSGVAPAVGFNIGGALLFALTVTGAFSLVYNLVASTRSARRATSRQNEEPGESDVHPPRPLPHPYHKIGIALLGALFVVLLSNLEAPLEVAHWKGLGSESAWQWLDIADLDKAPPSSETSQSAQRFTRPGWWWWRASRVIYDYDVRDWVNRNNKAADPPPHRRENIDEFPFFSFLLGDMHPHVLALPFVMLALTVSLALYRAGIAARRDFGAQVPQVTIPDTHMLLFALIFGALGFLNTWDFPIQWVVAVGAYTVGRLPKRFRFSDLRPHLRPLLALAITLAAGGLLLYVPFYISFQTQAGGPLVHVHSSTRLAHFTVMFGPLLFILIAFLGWGIQRARQRKALALRAGLRIGAVLLALALGVLIITALAIILSSSVRALVAPGLGHQEPVQVALRYLAMRLSAPWVTVLLVGIISAAAVLLSFEGLNQAARFSLVLVIAGAVMALIPDYVYLKDVFGVRINTVFKFYYQAWVLWAIASAGAVYTMLASDDRLHPRARGLFGLSLALVIGLGLFYPILAIPDRTKEFPEAPTLDGTAYFATERAADYAAIQWLNTHIEGAPVILETPGGAYEYEGRVSAQTGLPTLLGWAGHEQQWRGNTIEQDKRRHVIEELCTTADAQRTLTLLDEYDITYVYVGPLERAKCPATGLRKFDRLLEIVYDRDAVTIYKRRDIQGDLVGE